MFWACASKNDAVELLRSLGPKRGATDDRLLPPMFKATVENLDSSMSARSTSVVESRECSCDLSSSACRAASADGVSKSPKGVTEDVDVDPDRSVELLDVGEDVRDSVSRAMSALSSSVSGLSLAESESDGERKVCQHRFTKIQSLNGRTGLGIVCFGIGHLGQLSKGWRDLDVRHQEQP